MKRPRPHARRGLAAVGLCILMMVAIPLARLDLPRTTVGFVSRSLMELRSDGRGFRFDGFNIPDATGAPCWHPSDLSKSLDAIGPGQELARVYAFQRTATTTGVRDWTYLGERISPARSGPRAERAVRRSAQRSAAMSEGRRSVFRASAGDGESPHEAQRGPGVG
jgi:hypothetical protein